MSRLDHSSVLAGVALGALLFGAGALSAVTVPHVFVNGQVADAEQVNANFAAIADQFPDSCIDGDVLVWSSTENRFVCGEAIGGTYIPTDADYPENGLMLYVDAEVNANATSLDPTGDVPDTMTATHVDSPPYYWTDNGINAIIRWNADARWASGSYTVAGWYYHTTDARQALWSQFTGGNKFNWMADPGGEYHNNSAVSGGQNYDGGPWYNLNQWHFHVMSYNNTGELKISVDGNSSAVVTRTYTGDQDGIFANFSLFSRNDGFEYWDGHVAAAWYWDRALTSAELEALYHSTKDRFGVDRPYGH